ncbi:MAG: YciI family protein [Actinomycetia bacterium]|nr:YciI family protein [Actinomycetes bacterium]
MKRFVFLTYGFVPPTPEIMEAWNSWFASIGDKMVDSGGPSGGGREITRTGVKDLALDLEAFTGYVVINAADLDEATTIAETCPIITAIRVYEVRSM